MHLRIVSWADRHFAILTVHPVGHVDLLATELTARAWGFVPAPTVLASASRSSS
jgi:hypothetical protein